MTVRCINQIKIAKNKPLTNPILFQYIKIHVLREYLELELEIKDGVHTSIDNKIDDFIFLCFFVGNDFLPHLPSFRIRNGAIDLILSIYKSFLPYMNGYLTNDCKLNMENINFLLKKLALVEEDLDKGETQANQRSNNPNNKNNDKQNEQKIEDEILAMKNIVDFSKGSWRLSYYQSKFHVQESDMDDFLKKISKAYLEGINWVYKYYYSGWPSWEWYYPYHYAPLAIDLVNNIESEYKFNLGKPYKPVEQLMSVLPKQSCHALPKVLRPLLSNPLSEIIDFYPRRFSLDTNGFKFAWMGVNLLPFVDEKRLLKVVEEHLSEFSEEDKERNVMGWEQLIFDQEKSPSLAEISKESTKEDYEHNLLNSEGHKLWGILKNYRHSYVIDSHIKRPREGLRLDDIYSNKVHVLKLEIPEWYYHKCEFLDGVKELPKEVDSGDLELGDRRTFLGETSIRVLETKLGIQRDQTLIYQNSYSRNQLTSGYYNDGSLRGGHNNNQNSGVPYKRTAEQSSYQLGRQSYQQHKRVKTGDNYSDYSAPNSSQYGYTGGCYPVAGYQYYQSNSNYPPTTNQLAYNTNNSYNIPLRSPNETVQIRPPPTTQYSNFDRNRRPRQDRDSVQDKRDYKRYNNRFQDYDDKR